MAPSIPIQPQHTSSSPVTKRKVPRKKSKKGLLIAIARVLILVILVQNFAYPFLLQKVTGGVVSTLAVSTVKPEQEMDETVNPDQETVGTVSAAETRSVRSYAASIKNSYSWQLSGTEKSLFGRLNDKLKSTSQNSGAKEVGLLDVGSVLTAYAANGAAENPVATDVANIASVLSLYGYDKLSRTVCSSCEGNLPIRPL